MEETDSTSSQTEKSNTWEEGTTISSEESQENSVWKLLSGSAGFSGFGVSVEVSSLTQGSQSSYGYSRSDSDSVTDTNSSKTASLTKTFSTNICNTKSSTTDVNTDNEESTDKAEDFSFQKSYEIPGDMRQVLQ